MGAVVGATSLPKLSIRVLLPSPELISLNLSFPSCSSFSDEPRRSTARIVVKLQPFYHILCYIFILMLIPHFLFLPWLKMRVSSLTIKLRRLLPFPASFRRRPTMAGSLLSFSSSGEALFSISYLSSFVFHCFVRGSELGFVLWV